MWLLACRFRWQRRPAGTEGRQRAGRRCAGVARHTHEPFISVSAEFVSGRTHRRQCCMDTAPPAPAPAPRGGEDRSAGGGPWVLRLGNYLSGKEDNSATDDDRGWAVRLGSYLSERQPGPWSLIANEKPQDPLVRLRATDSQGYFSSSYSLSASLQSSSSMLWKSHLMWLVVPVVCMCLFVTRPSTPHSRFLSLSLSSNQFAHEGFEAGNLPQRDEAHRLAASKQGE